MKTSSCYLHKGLLPSLGGVWSSRRKRVKRVRSVGKGRECPVGRQDRERERAFNALFCFGFWGVAD